MKDEKIDKQSVDMHAEVLVQQLLGGNVQPAVLELSLASAAEVLDVARDMVRELAFERLRKIEVESGQLRMIVGEDPRQRRSDRTAEEQAALDVIRKGKFVVSDVEDRDHVPMTAAEIARETKLGARINPVLARLAKQRLVESSGKGPKAVWGIGPADPSYVARPKVPEPEAPVGTSPLATTNTAPQVAAAAVPDDDVPDFAPPDQEQRDEAPPVQRASLVELAQIVAPPPPRVAPPRVRKPAPSKPEDDWS